MTLSEILNQLPETDRELQAKEPPPQTPEEQKRRRRDQYPESWGSASKFTAPNPTLARKLVGEVLAGGRAKIVELIRLLDTPADYKPDYLLRCVALFSNEKEKRLLVRTIASESSNSQARQLLVRELQWIGGDDAINALEKLLTDESLCGDAAAALASIGSSAELRKAFPKSTGKCRVALAQGLGATRDPKSADLLRKTLGDADPEVRFISGWGLARIGDTQSIDALIKAADSAQGYVRAKATSNVLLLAETLAMQGKKTEAGRIYNHLLNTRTDPKEKYVRDAAAKHITVFTL